MNSPAKQAATGMPPINETRNITLNNLTITEPLIKKQFSSGQVGVPDTSNIMSVHSDTDTTADTSADTLPTGNRLRHSASRQPMYPARNCPGRR